MPQDCWEVSKAKEKLLLQDLMDKKVEDQRRKCLRCKIDKPLSEFYAHTGHNKEKVYFYTRHKCKKCMSEIRKIEYKKNPQFYISRTVNYYKRHPEKTLIRNIRKSAIIAGLNPKETEIILKNHNGICEICKKPDIKGRRLSIDHNHKTRKFRGFLCLKCNNGLGCFGDNVELLTKAINYLKEK